jgi:hypothetical protein
MKKKGREEINSAGREHNKKKKKKKKKITFVLNCVSCGGSDHVANDADFARGLIHNEIAKGSLSEKDSKNQEPPPHSLFCFANEKKKKVRKKKKK